MPGDALEMLWGGRLFEGIDCKRRKGQACIIDKNAGRPPPELAFERGIRSLTVLHT